MKDSRHLLLLLLVLCLAACTPEEPPPPDVSDVAIDLTVLRFDSATNDSLPALRQQFGSFTDVYFTELVPVRRGDFGPQEQARVLQAYRDYPLTQYVDSLVQQAYAGPQVQTLTEDFAQALRYYKHYFPDAALPDTLVTYTANFELAAFLYGTGQLAAGLDFFLGPDFDYEQVAPEEPIFSAYLAQSYTPANFSGKLMRVLLEDRYPAPRSGRLVDYLMYEGKKLYLLERLLPATPDHLVYEITEAQLAWLRDNETQIYAHLQQADDFYTTDVSKINKYTRPAPTSPGMPAASPGGAVNYLGRQIVAAYLTLHPDVTLDQLMGITDGQEILRGARYKPR